MLNLNDIEIIIIALYARKSVLRDTSISVKLQILNMKDYFIKLYGNRCEFHEFIDDGYTGKNESRPAFQRMIAGAKQNNFNIVSVYKTDRCARNNYDFNILSKSLESLGVILVSTSEGCDSSTTEGRMIMNIFSIIAEWEGSQISDRVRDSMESLAKLGCFSGGSAPAGYEITRLPYKSLTTNKKLSYLKIDPEAKVIINEIFTLAAEGYTIYKIATKLNIPPKTIANIIENPTYVAADEKSSEYLISLGYSVYGELNGSGFLPYNRRCKKKVGKESNSKEKFIAVSLHEPIVSSDIWICANKNVKSRGKEKRPRISNKSFLAHIPKCSCGSGMFVHQTGSKNSKYETSYFRCSAQKQSKSCNSTWFRVDELESLVLSTLKDFKLDKLTLEQYCHSKNNIYIDYDSLIAQKNSEIFKLEQQLNNLCINLRSLTGRAADYVNKDIKAHELKIQEIENEIAKLETESQNNLDKLDLDTLTSHIKWFITNFNKIPIEDRQLFAKNIISKIEYNGSDKAKVTF